MGRYMISFDRENCIGCGNCTIVCPKFYEVLTDGASSIKGGKTVRKNWQVLKVEKKDYQCNVKAARSCPVNVIHLNDLKTGKKII